MNFYNIAYLKHGNTRQKQAYAVLKHFQVFEILRDYHPLLAGTIPIDIDLPESDLDIICECSDSEAFTLFLERNFEKYKDFNVRTSFYNGLEAIIATFKMENFNIEIFGQNIPTHEQNAFRHMLIEHQILEEKGQAFKAKIRELKKAGMKTEPAFAKLLNLKGNPYLALLEYHS